MNRISLFLAGSFFTLSVLFSCQTDSSLKPVISVVDSEHVMFNSKKVEITSLQRAVSEYRMTLEPQVRDSIQIQFEIERGIDQDVVQKIKDELQKAGIRDLKFVAPFN